MRFAFALALVALPACIEVQGFACEPNACDLDGRDGVCESEGYCSYPSDDCPSGRRFEARAPGDLGGACVEPASDSSSTSTSTMTGTTLQPSTGSSDTSSSGGVPCDGDGCGWTAVESGPLHTCALDGNGAVWCWGVGAGGELGIGSNAAFRSCPAAPAVGLSGQQILSVGGHTCAVGSDGLSCWGPNGDLQVDWTSQAAVFLEPHAVPIDDRRPVDALGVGERDTCVGIEDRLICWGGGSPAAEPVVAPSPIVSVEVGNAHYCGLLEDETTWCIGADLQGQLGGGLGDQTPGPVQPDLNGERALKLSVGARHACAITEGTGPAARNIKCWGDNRSYQAGSVVELQLETPRDVSGNLVPDAWVDIAAGVDHSCAVNAEGEVWCWGNNDFGQVDPYAEEFGQLLTASRIDLDPVVDAVDIAVATTITCVIDRDAQWWCWGCLEPWMVDSNEECTVSPPTLFEPCE